jgi:nitrogen fixation protein FixH
MSAAVMNNPEPTKVTGRKVLLWLVASFMIVAAVNGLMVYFAISTFTGQTDSHPYAQGLTFNKTLLAIAAQRAVGWQVDGKVADRGRGVVSVTVTYRDREGRSLDDLAVVARFSRPTNDGQDFEATLAHQGAGLYTADVPMPAEGQWLVRLTAGQNGREPYLLDYRVIVQ